MKFWLIAVVLLLVAAPLMAQPIIDANEEQFAKGAQPLMTSDQQSYLIILMFLIALGLWGIRTRIGLARVQAGGRSISMGGRRTKTWWNHGTAEGHKQLAITRFRASTTVNGSYAGGTPSAHTNVTQSTNIQDSFTLVSANGQSHSIQMDGFNLPSIEGHLVYCVAGKAGLRKRWLIVRDLTTGAIVTNRKTGHLVTGGLLGSSYFWLGAFGVCCALYEVVPGWLFSVTVAGYLVSLALGTYKVHRWKSTSQRLVRQLDPYIIGG